VLSFHAFDYEGNRDKAKAKNKADSTSAAPDMKDPPMVFVVQPGCLFSMAPI
jgi:hypothetical protein